MWPAVTVPMEHLKSAMFSMFRSFRFSCVVFSFSCCLSFSRSAFSCVACCLFSSFVCSCASDWQYLRFRQE